MEMEMKMKAIVITSGPEVVQLQDVADPTVGDNDVLIKIAAAALNRADLQQRNDLCPPPKGASPYPGLECSGTVIAVGSSVSRWKPGDQVCALLSGGGYAEKVAVPAGQVLPAPMGVSLRDAASFPEVACTVWSTVFMTSRLSAGESFLIHGGSSGIGTFAIQIAKHIGAKVFVTAGSEEHLAACKNLGADVGINYKTEDFALRVKEETGGKGVDVILDIIGAPYLQRNLDSLNMDGRLFIIGFQGGTITEVDLSCLLARRLTIQAAGLRNRSPENKAVIVEEVEKNVWPAIATGDVKPVVDKAFPLSDAVEAHKLMQSSHIDLMEDIYILQPEGYAIIGNDNQVCKLGKLLYCLKQSSRQQYKKCDPFMIEQEFVRNTYDPYIYTRELDDGPLICLSLYVDMLIVVKSIEEIDKLRALKCV